MCILIYMFNKTWTSYLKLIDTTSGFSNWSYLYFCKKIHMISLALIPYNTHIAHNNRMDSSWYVHGAFDTVSTEFSQLSVANSVNM